MEDDLQRALRRVNDYPGSVDSYHAFIPVAIERLQLDAAMRAAEAALEIDALNHDSWLLAARVLEEKGDLSAAIKIYEQLTGREPGIDQYRYHLGINQFCVGDLSAGLENFKYRSGTLGYEAKPHVLAELRGSGTEGILLTEEQGIGDQIMFLQFLPYLESDFSALTVQIDPRLISLYENNFPNIRFISRNRPVRQVDSLTAFPLGDLFLIGLLPLLANSFQPPILSLAIGNAAVEKAPTVKRLIGLSWRTMAQFGALKRSISFKYILDQLDPERHKLVFLQYLPQPEDEELAAGLGFEFEIPHDTFDDIYGVAQWILKCDKVITIDNYIAHLSGALGAETLVLLPFSASYRWHLKRDFSPIYKNVVLRRQKEVGDWGGIIEGLIDP